MSDKLEYLLNRASMVALLIAGGIFIYEGIVYMMIKKQHPEYPSKLITAGVLAIVLGVIEVVFGVWHIWL